jgi:L-cysteine/cystine lyase
MSAGSHTSSQQLSEFRHKFPALANKSYFNFGGQGVLPQQALDAIIQSFKYVQENGPFSSRMFDWLQDEVDKTKDALAAELGASRRSIALTQNVSEGCNIVMWGIDWQQGDHLLITDSEHGSINEIADCIAKRRRVAVSKIVLSSGNVAPSEQLENAITERTRLVVLSHVLWNTGRVLDLAPLIEICKAKAVPLLVDGAQSAGAMSLDLKASGVDYYAMTGHKWMCGPEGVGCLYIREDLLDCLQPTYVGWRGMEMGGPHEPDATRFEIATSAFPLFAGLRSALAVHREWASAPERHEQIRANASYLRQQLAEKVPGISIITPGEVEAGLVSFAIDSMSPGAIVARLEAQHIYTRTIPYPKCVRASVHYFTTREEIDQLIETLAG